MKNKRSPKQIAAFKKMRAACRAKIVDDPPSAIGRRGSRKSNPVRSKTKRAPAPAAPVARVSKRKPKRKSNPAPAPSSAKVVSNPTENTVKANRRRRKKSRRRTPPRTKSGRFRKSRRRRNPVAVRGNPVKANRKKNIVGRGERRVGAKRRNTKRGRVKGYSRKSPVKGHIRRTNPVTGLMSNQGPFTATKLVNYGVATLGLGIGFFATDLIDRVVATMKPSDGRHPWFGRAAVAAQLSRPTAIRLGAQAATGLAAMGAAYITRNVRFVPWFFSGLASAAGANFVKMGLQWFIGPIIFPLKGDDFSKPVFANRLYVVEQKAVQDVVADIFKDWKSSASLSAAQAETPLITGPLTGATTSVYTLGGLDPRDLVEIVQNANLSGHGQLAGPQFRADGTDGSSGPCRECGSVGGHQTSCSNHCEDCSAVFDYEVDRHDNLLGMAREAGIDPNYVSGLNGSRSLSLVKPGEKIKVPFLFGRWMQDKYGPQLERHPGNQNGGLAGAEPAPQQRAAGQDFTEIDRGMIDPAE